MFNLRILFILSVINFLSSGNVADAAASGGAVNSSAIPADDSSGIIMKPRFSQERIDFVKRAYAKNPDLTMHVKVPGLKEMYHYDLEYIKYQVSQSNIYAEKAVRDGKNPKYFQRDPAVITSIIDNLILLDSYVNKAFGEELTFAEYTFISNQWSTALSATEASSNEDSYKRNFEFFSYYVQKIKEGKTPRIDITAQYDFVLAHSIVMPVVNKSGLVSIESMNEGFAFSVMDKDGIERLKSLNFVGVATNARVDYDNNKLTSPFMLWGHDNAHFWDGNMIESHTLEAYQRNLINAWHYRQKMLKEPRESIRRKQMELVYFIKIHEGIRASNDADLDLEENLKESIVMYRKYAEALKMKSGDTKNRSDLYGLLDALKLPVSDGVSQELAFYEHMVEGADALLNA